MRVWSASRVTRASVVIAAVMVLACASKTAEADLNLNLAYVSATYNLGYGAEGAAWDGTHLWICDSPASSTTLIRQYDTSSGFSFVRSIPMPTTALRGLTWDGEKLWASKFDTYYGISPVDGSIVDTTFSVGTGSLGGLTYDGQYLWKSSRPEFHAIHIPTGNTFDSIFTIDLPGIEEGLTYEGGDLYAISYTTSSDSTIWHIDLDTKTVTADSFRLPSGLYNGLTYDGENLWAADWSGGRVVKISFAVPEPSPLVILLIALAGVVQKRNRRVRIS